MTFPIFRKYKNNQSYFMVESSSKFEEIKLESGKWKRYSFEVSILPDRNFILDMCTNYELYWDEITENEYMIISNQVV